MGSVKVYMCFFPRDPWSHSTHKAKQPHQQMPSSRPMKPINQLFTNCCWCRDTGHHNSVLFAFFRIHDLTNAPDWLVSLWLTGDRVFAILPIQKTQPILPILTTLTSTAWKNSIFHAILCMLHNILSPQIHFDLFLMHLLYDDENAPALYSLYEDTMKAI